MARVALLFASMGLAAACSAPGASGAGAARPPRHAPAQTVASQGAVVDGGLSASAAGASPGERQDAQAVAMKLSRFLLTRGIDRREPVDQSNEFTTGERVYAFIHLTDVQEPQELKVHWEAVSGRMRPANKRLRVRPSRRFRTWSSIMAPLQPGTYRCVVTSVDGTVLAEEWFDVDPG